MGGSTHPEFLGPLPDQAPVILLKCGQREIYCIKRGKYCRFFKRKEKLRMYLARGLEGRIMFFLCLEVLCTLC